jgi:very-short-patch-repair endonuclease
VKVYDEARTGAVQRARGLRRASTEAEKRLWCALRVKLPQFKWRRQMPIGPYFVDFACFAEKLIIEALGYRVLRFWNNDILSNTNGVLERIMQELSTSPSRSCAAGPSLSLGRGELEPCQ